MYDPTNNHREFKKFQYAHEGAVSVLFATGPSLNDFDYSEIPDSPSVRAGVNSFIYQDHYDLDYYFCSHDVSKEGPAHPHSDIEKSDPIREKIKSRSSDVQVFCRPQRPGDAATFWTEEDTRYFNAVSYDITREAGKDAFATYLEYQPLYNHSIIFPALQFLLYTGVGKIYLVGCDCGGAASYLMPDEPRDDGGWGREDLTVLRPHWEDFRSFIAEKYPRVEIISVNPRGLRGMFKDCGTHYE